MPSSVDNPSQLTVLNRQDRILVALTECVMNSSINKSRLIQLEQTIVFYINNNDLSL